MEKKLIDLCKAKVEGRSNLMWDDIAEQCGYLRSDGHKIRKRFYRFQEKSKNFTFNPDKSEPKVDYDLIKFEKEKQKFYDERTAFKKLIRDEARRESLKDIIFKAVENNSNLPVLETYDFTDMPVYNSDNDLLITLNDLHFGADIKNAFNEYNSDICRERLAEYVDEILEIQARHGSENCFVCANGDLINGAIHRTVAMANKENVIEQVMGVSEAISQFLAELGKYFEVVHLVVVSGNHSRIGENKNDSLMEERLDSIIPFYVKARLQNAHNIFVHDNIDETMTYVNIRGKNYLQVHGDYDSSEKAIQNVALMAGVPIYAVVCGHLHHFKTEEINNMIVVMSGSFLGCDDYCISKRIISKPSQTVCVCDEDGIKCLYKINF